MIETLRLLSLFVMLIGAALSDLTAYRIPNSITVGGAVLGLLLALFGGEDAVKASLIGFAAALAAGVLLWLVGALRAGDAKLYAAVGMLLGWRGVLNCFLWSMLIAGTAGVALLLSRRALLGRMKRLWEYVKGLFLTRQFTPYAPESGSERELPLGLPIALGGALAVCLPLF